ncbi:hypothetical protein EDC94DRAFT_693140 [Helicostylum pulchrum]|nr:hypothetical protein EDC94DRAFT_693140 [Helicostylum pulchrum]
MELVMNGPSASPNNDIKEKVLGWFRAVSKFQRNIPTLQNELQTAILPAAIENHTLNVEVDDSRAITNPLYIECVRNKLIRWLQINLQNTAKQGRANGSLLKKKSRFLGSKAIDSAVNMTDKALDILKEFTVREMDNNELINKEAANIDDVQGFMGPARIINHTQNLPKLQNVHIEVIKKKCYIAISSMPVSMIPSFLRKELEKNQANEKAFASLGRFPHVLTAIKHMMDEDVVYETFPMNLWSFQAQAITWSTEENNFYSVVSIVLTDFWGLFKRDTFNIEHERTFWVEYVVPVFKHFFSINKGVIFSWCESMVLSHSKSQTVFGVRNNPTEKRFADGIARNGESEVIIMESSGPFSEEYTDHSFPNASIDTAKELSIFGVQCIKNQLTLMKTSLHDPNKWKFVELRGASIPVTWDERTDILPVFELLATLQNEYDAQKNVLKKLRRENIFFGSR